ncbi:MAG TPA: arginine deiminase family protein [Thermoleophilaceae bacterium]|jgi:N-dimethylarginine dimethylaminohydrolase
MSEQNVKVSDYPGYRPGAVAQYAQYHDEVDFLDEIELIWGKRWGAQGIGRLREVAMSPPTESESLPLYDEAPAFFAYGGALPDLGLMREQHARLAETYRSLGITVHEFLYPEEPRSAYGPMKRAVSAAAGFVINGGAIIAREATPYWRGRSRYVTRFLVENGCPILMTVHGKGVCEGGAFTRMADDFIVGMLSTDANQEGIDQIRPVLERAGYRLWVARSPGPLYDFHPEVPGWMHSDMWIAPLDARLALIYPPWCDFETIRYLRSIGYRLIEAPRVEQEELWPVNMITIEPRKVVLIEGAHRTRALLEAEDVETIEVPYADLQAYGGGIRCTTMQLIRDPGPRVFD